MMVDPTGRRCNGRLRFIDSPASLRLDSARLEAVTCRRELKFGATMSPDFEFLPADHLFCHPLAPRTVLDLRCHVIRRAIETSSSVSHIATSFRPRSMPTQSTLGPPVAALRVDRRQSGGTPRVSSQRRQWQVSGGEQERNLHCPNFFLATRTFESSPRFDFLVQPLNMRGCGGGHLLLLDAQQVDCFSAETLSFWVILETNDTYFRQPSSLSEGNRSKGQSGARAATCFVVGFESHRWALQLCCPPESSPFEAVGGGICLSKQSQLFQYFWSELRLPPVAGACYWHTCCCFLEFGR